jgi:chorismate-pyruvate lyase
MTGAAPAGAADLASALRCATGTVTEFLEELAGEPIDAEIIAQLDARADDDDPLGLAPHTELMRRAVFLTGRTTRRRFVYAESAIATQRLPDSVRQRLEASRDPIGRILRDHRLRIHREPLADPAMSAGLERRVTTLLRASALARRYRIVVNRTPVIAVSEWFLTPATVAFAQLRH